ncbi:MAG: hypothetical protein HYZ93_02875, partial [Candidatus Omnitrophica bacterium]|nr:hypothetical protein [Candidatus Omnitrophota bacterium]
MTLREGVNGFYRSIRDRAGNGNSAYFTVTLDSTPLLTLLSAAITTQAGYPLRYDVDGEIREEAVLLKEGANLITRSATSSTGKKAEATWTVTLDSRPPEVILLSKTATNQAGYQLRYSVDGQPQEEIVPLAQGANRLERRFTDAAGNETAAAWTITLDTTPPILRLLSPTLSNSLIYLLRYEVDGAAREETTRLDEGANTITRQITDEAGNETVASWVITADSTPPAVALASPALTNQPTYRLGYTVDGEPRSEELSLQEGPNRITRTFTDLAGNPTTVNWTLRLDTQPPAVTRTSPGLTNQTFHHLTYTVDGEAEEETVSLSEGENTLTRTFKDPAGNEAAVTWTITLDTLPPAANLTSPTLTDQIRYRLLYAVDGENREEVLTLSEGSNAVTRIFRDAAGNSATANWTITLDTLPPVVALVSPSLTNRAGYALTYTVDGAPLEEQLTLTEGANTITRTHQDPAGNATTSTWVITLDTVAPRLALVSSTLTNQSSYTLTYTVDREVVSETVTLQEGANAISRTKTDTAGNPSTATWTITLDTLPPQVELASSAVTKNPGYRLRYKVDGTLTEEQVSLVEGLNALQRTVRDSAGNSLIARFAITLDTLPPVVALASPSLTNQAGYALTYTVDGQARTETVSLNNGVNQIQRTLSDLAGNETTVTWPITLDTTPPVVVLTSPAETGSSPYRLTYTADGQPQEETVNLQAGVNTVTRTARDAAGNETAVTWAITYRGPPEIQVTSSDTASNPQYSLTYTVDGQPVTEQWLLAPGENRLMVRAANPFGAESVKLFKVTLASAPFTFPDPPSLPAQGQLLTQTLANGVIASFRDGQLVSFEIPGQGIVLGPQLDSEGRITRGWLKQTDGTLAYIEEGRAKASRLTDGTVALFDPEGRVVREEFSGTGWTTSAYRKNGAGEIVATSLAASAGQAARYLADGSLDTLVSSDGSTAYWKDRMLAGIILPEGERVVYAKEESPQGGTLLTRPADRATSWPKLLRYNTQGQLTEAWLQDGTQILLKEGIPAKVRAPDGTLTEYQPDSQAETIQGLFAARQGITRRYDTQGQLVSATLSDGSTLNFQGETLTGIQIPQGTLTHATLDAQGKLSSGTLTRPDGTVALIRDGRLAEANLPDGSKVLYAHGQPSQLTLPDANTYTLNQTGSDPSQWVATLNLTGSDPTGSDPSGLFVSMVYSEDWQLLQATRADGARLEYTQGRLTRLLENGSITTYLYDSAGRLSRTVTTSADAAQMPVTTEYAYDKIRRVFKGSDPAGSDPSWVLLYEYSYEFPADGAEITAVREVATGLVKRYREGQLLSQTDA